MRRTNSMGKNRGLVEVLKKLFCIYEHSEGTKSQSLLSKKAFLKLRRSLCFSRRICSTHFSSKLWIQKILLRVSVIFWYNLEHHATRRKDSTIADSYFCRLQENDAPGSSHLEIEILVFECVLQQCSTSRCRRNVGNSSKMSRVRSLDALDIDLSIAHSIKSIQQLHVENIENEHVKNQ